MGKQSARLWYKGKDHKDIYCRARAGALCKPHCAMFRSDSNGVNKLVWKKILEGEHFCMVGIDTHNVPKILVFIKEDSEWVEYSGILNTSINNATIVQGYNYDGIFISSVFATNRVGYFLFSKDGLSFSQVNYNNLSRALTNIGGITSDHFYMWERTNATTQPYAHKIYYEYNSSGKFEITGHDELYLTDWEGYVYQMYGRFVTMLTTQPIGIAIKQYTGVRPEADTYWNYTEYLWEDGVFSDEMVGGHVFKPSTFMEGNNGHWLRISYSAVVGDGTLQELRYAVYSSVTIRDNDEIVYENTGTFYYNFLPGTPPSDNMAVFPYGDFYIVMTKGGADKWEGNEFEYFQVSNDWQTWIRIYLPENETYTIPQYKDDSIQGTYTINSTPVFYNFLTGSSFDIPHYNSENEIVTNRKRFFKLYDRAGTPYSVYADTPFFEDANEMFYTPDG